MKRKALFLLLIFLLNTATGFACVIRMSNHEQKEIVEHHHEAKDTAKHHHQGENTKHPHEHEHLSQPTFPRQLLLNETYIAKNDPCCQAAVSNFNALAKVTPQSNYVTLLAPFIYIGMHYQFFLKPVPNSSKSNQLSSLNERRRPPTYPIRIAIKSFQI